VQHKQWLREVGSLPEVGGACDLTHSGFRFAALLARGVPADIRSQHGACPSHLAAEEGHVKVLEVLAGAGADLDKTAAPSCAWTPLYFAAAQVYQTS